MLSVMAYEKSNEVTMPKIEDYPWSLQPFHSNDHELPQFWISCSHEIFHVLSRITLSHLEVVYFAFSNNLTKNFQVPRFLECEYQLNWIEYIE